MLSTTNLHTPGEQQAAESEWSSTAAAGAAASRSKVEGLGAMAPTLQLRLHM